MRFRMLIVLGLVLVVSPCFGKVITGSVDQTATISHTVGEATKSRILVELDIPALPEGTSVEYAELTIPFTPEGEANVRIKIEAYRVTTEWAAETATWTSPWTTAGGDFDTDSRCAYAYDSEHLENFYLEITKIVSAWHDGSADYGLILSGPHYADASLGPEVQDLVTALADAEVEVHCVQMAR